MYSFIFGYAGSSLLCELSLVVASGGYSLVAMRGLLIAVASFLEHRLWSIWASVVAVHGLSSLGSWTLEHRTSSCGSQTWLLRGMRDLPRPGIEPVSPALTGEFFTIEPLGKALVYSSMYMSIPISRFIPSHLIH